jgi:hypothetical protein
MTAAREQNRILVNAIINECAKLKQGEKALTKLSDLLTARESRDYFLRVAQKAKDIIQAQKAQSGFGHFYSNRLPGDDDTNRPRRK